MLVDGMDNIEQEQLTSIYERHLFLATCVNYIAERVASVPLRFYSTKLVNGEKQRELADDSEAAKVFRWWNPHQSALEAWETVCAWWLLTGLGYIAKLSSDDPKYPYELWPLVTPGVQPMKGPNGIEAYRYRVEGTETILLPEEVIPIRSFAAGSRFGGMGKVQPGRRQLITDIRAREWNDNLLKNGVHISGFLQGDEEMRPESAKKIREHFEDQYAGSSKAYRIMVLYGGLKFSPSTFAHKDILWAEQLSMTREDISLAMGVSLEVLGLKSPNRAALEEKRKIFWEDTVKPIGKRFSESVNSNFLVKEEPGVEAAFDYSEISALQPDRTEQVKAGQIAISSGQYTINEYRADVLKMEPVEGGDVTLIGRGLVPIEQLTQSETQLRQRELRTRKSLKLVEDEFLANIEKLRDQTETRLQGVVRQSSRKMESAVIEAIKTTSVDEVISNVDQIIYVEGREVMVAESVKQLEVAMEKSGSAVNAAIGVESSFTLRNTRAEVLLRRQKGDIIGIGSRQARALRIDLAEGLASGESEAGLKARVQSFFRNERSNALTIARTETTRAINGAAREALVEAKKLGVITKMEWRASQDEKVRGAHSLVHGTSIDPVEEMFIVNGEHLAYPGDRENGSPSNTINCRCATIPIVIADTRTKEWARSEFTKGEYLENEVHAREAMAVFGAGNGDER
jgi:HK97 family phage portal protein